MLLNWFTQSIPASLTATLNENDLNVLTSQYCTNLVIAGIIKPLTDNHDNASFKVSLRNPLLPSIVCLFRQI